MDRDRQLACVERRAPLDVTGGQRRIADRLDAFASLLELAEANPYTAARLPARGRDDPRARRSPVAELVRAGRVRELRGIGPGIEARLRELVETGEIAELAELERELAPGLVGLGRYLGLSAQALDRDRAGARTSARADELREAAAAGRLRTSRASARRPRRSCSRRSRARPSREPQRGLLLDRARELVGGIAAALDGEAAGDVRRWRDACEQLAVVCAAADPSPALERFAALPQIVAVIERRERRAVGVTVEGVPVELVVADAAGASGPRSCARPARRRTSRRSSRCPDAPDEAAVYARARRPVVPAGAARGAVPRRAAGARRARPTSAATCTATRPGRTAARASRRWAAPPASAATSTSRSATTRRPSAPSAGSPPTTSAARPRRSPPPTSVLAPFRVLRGIECDILPDGRLDLPDDVLAELDWVQASVHGGQRMPRARDDQARRGGAAQPVRALPQPPDGPAHQPPPRERARPRARVRGRARDTASRSRSTACPPASTCSGEHVREALRAGVRIVCSTDAHSTRGLGNMPLSVHTARRGWATPADVLNTRPLRSILDVRRAARA